MRIISLLLLIMCLFSGCSHPDDDLCSVPVTNNPHFIVDSQRGSALPGGFSM